MSRFLRHIPNRRDRITAGAAGGLAGALAYAVVQKFDLETFGYNTDDLVLLGRMVSGDDGLIRPVGLAMHCVNGTALGVVYALAVHDRLPGSPLVRGLTFAMIETAGLYPMALLERFHPGIREGRLQSYLTGTAFTQQVFRHIAYGATLGPVVDRLLYRK